MAESTTTTETLTTPVVQLNFTKTDTLVPGVQSQIAAANRAAAELAHQEQLGGRNVAKPLSTTQQTRV